MRPETNKSRAPASSIRRSLNLGSLQVASFMRGLVNYDRVSSRSKCGEARTMIPQWSSLHFSADEHRDGAVDDLIASARSDGRSGFFVSAASDADTATTDWGESVRVRVSSADTLYAMAVLDYAAPARFGTPRHVHRNDDEIFIVESGELAIWTPDRSDLARAGDVVHLPRHVPHAWHGTDDDPIRLRVIASPGEVRHLVPALVRRGAKMDDRATFAAVASDAGVEILGPPLDDDEVASIVARGAVARDRRSTETSSLSAYVTDVTR